MRILRSEPGFQGFCQWVKVLLLNPIPILPTCQPCLRHGHWRHPILCGWIVAPNIGFFQALRLRIYERTEDMKGYVKQTWICQSTYKLRVPTLWDLQAGNQW